MPLDGIKKVVSGNSWKKICKDKLMVKHNSITRFALLRHGQTEWNRKKRIQGQEDSPLTPEGKKEAESWGHALKDIHFDRILTSDLGRALETASLINQALEVPLVKDFRLREQDWGRWTGKTLAQLRKEENKRLSYEVEAGWKFCPPGGEDRYRVWQRGQEALQIATKNWKGDKILLVTHEGVIKCLIYHLEGRKFLPSEPRLIRGNRIHWLYHDEMGMGIDRINVRLIHSGNALSRKKS